MYKYLLVAKSVIDQRFLYRTNFLLFRLRTIIQFLATYFLWTSIIPAGSSLSGYSHSSILTYVLGVLIISAFTLSTASTTIGDDVLRGNLSNYLLRPINYFLYYFSKDVGEKTLHLIFSIFEITILYFLLRPPLFFQHSIITLLLAMVFIIIGIIINFLLNLLLGAIGFWSSEIWAPRFLFTILASFLGGTVFPLDIFPQAISVFFHSLPFQYLVYVPIKIYLGQVSLTNEFILLMGGIAWIIILSISVQAAWRKGLTLYTSQGI